MSKVVVTMEIDVPERETGNIFYGDFEDTLLWWEENPSATQVAEAIKYVLEDESRGLAEFNGVNVTKLKFV
jgi:2-phospho-L-lactate transferase/gluconeogenesis factor (CofD/UPF0052 family)